MFYLANFVRGHVAKTAQSEHNLYECEYNCGFTSESYEETVQHEEEHKILRNAFSFLRPNVSAIVLETETANAKVAISRTWTSSICV